MFFFFQIGKYFFSHWTSISSSCDKLKVKRFAENDIKWKKCKIFDAKPNECEHFCWLNSTILSSFPLKWFNIIVFAFDKYKDKQFRVERQSVKRQLVILIHVWAFNFVFCVYKLRSRQFEQKKNSSKLSNEAENDRFTIVLCCVE